MNANHKHIALFISDLSGGGVPKMTLNLAHGLVERGHRVDLITVKADGPRRSELSQRVRYVALAAWWSRLPWVASKRRRQIIASMPALVRYLRRERPDALISADHWVNFCAVAAHALARVPTRLAVSQRMHLSGRARYGPSLRWLVPRLYPRADAIVAVSNGVAEDLCSAAGLPAERISTIYNPVVTPELKERAQIPLDHPWFAPNSPPVVLGVGSLVSRKDFATLVKAFHRVRTVRPARLMILGDGAKRKGLTALAERLGIADDLELPGFVANPYAYMARASVFVLSSTLEGLPGALIEALACGCPVVSTDCPSGAAEILDGGAYGPLVPVGDDAAMAEAIHTALDSPPNRDRLLARAAEFSVERAVDRYLELLFTGARLLDRKDQPTVAAKEV